MGRDFMEWTKPVDWIATNPPWSAKAYCAISRHAFKLVHNVMFLIRIQTALGTYARLNDFREFEHGLKEIIVVRWENAGLAAPLANDERKEGLVLACLHWQRG